MTMKGLEIYDYNQGRFSTLKKSFLINRAENLHSASRESLDCSGICELSHSILRVFFFALVAALLHYDMCYVQAQHQNW